MSTTITRKQFQQAIEAGLDNALHLGALNEEDAAKIREVGKTAQHAAWSLFTTRDENGTVCGCPVMQSGIVSDINSDEQIPWPFTDAFDAAISRLPGAAGSALLDIVDDDPRPIVPRDTFVAAIAAGIDDASASLTDDERAALVKVGAEAKTAAIARFTATDPVTNETCGCPLTQAGLASNGAPMGFMFTYDDFMRVVVPDRNTSVVRIEG